MADVDDRILESIREIVREVFPRLTFMGKFQYTIQSVSGTSPDYLVDVAAVDTTIGLPANLSRVPLLSVCGATVHPTSGSQCVVEFLNYDPTRPRVTSLDPSPTSIALGASPVPLAKATPVSSLISALSTFSTALTAAAGAPTYAVFSPAAVAASTALGVSLAALPSVPTTVTTAT